MALKDTKEDLYNPKSDLEKRERSKSIFDEELSGNMEGSFLEEKTFWEKISNGWLNNDKRVSIYVAVVVLGLILTLALAFILINKFKQTAFSEQRVEISVEGDTSVDSSQETTYLIKYQNKNRVSLNNVEIILNHSENFYPDESEGLKKINQRSSQIILSEIKPFENGEIKFSGKFYALENYLVYLQPNLRYKPSNFNSFFEVTSQLGVKVISSSVNLVVDYPREALDESSIYYEIKYENTGTTNLSDLNLRLKYSDGFYFQSAIPNPISDNNSWHLGDLNIGTKGAVKVIGRVDGQRYDTKLIKATIFKNTNNNSEIIYAKADGVTKIVVPPLTITHRVNDQTATNINLGNVLKYRITYSNQGDLGLKDVNIKLKIDSPIIDYENLDIGSGAYFSDGNYIIWKASDIPALKKLDPGNSGQIEVSVPIKEMIDINKADDRNFTIESVASIDSSDQAFHSLGNASNISNTVLSKLNSKVILESNVYFKDDNIENSGPVPQKVGEETTYTVSWKVTNVSNDVSDVKVSAYLPTWITWKNVIFPAGESVSFNERTHEVFWNIGKMESGKGLLNEPKEVKFQIGLTPQINQVGEIVDLVNKTVVNGKDDFTDSEIDVEVNKASINLKEFTNSNIRGTLIIK